MPGETLLSFAHDVSQDLQDQLETLPNVERAFVHVDHEVSHQPVSLDLGMLCSEEIADELAWLCRSTAKSDKAA